MNSTKMRTALRATICTFVGLLSMPRIASACVQCVIGMCEYVLPHTLWWCLGILIWFCALMLVAAGDENLSLSPRRSRHCSAAVGLFVLTVLLGSASMGPPAFALLGLIAFCTTVKGFGAKMQRRMAPLIRRRFKGVRLRYNVSFCLITDSKLNNLVPKLLPPICRLN